MKLARKTLGVRHWCLRLLCKVVAPTVGNLFDKKYRPAIGAVKEKFGDEAVVGAEIGVAEGRNAEWILKTLNVKRLYLIDPYEPYYDKGVLCDQSVAVFALAQKRLQNHRNLFWMPVSSDEAAELILEKLDFVYIDGDHNYFQCFLDITKYSSLVKKGGIVGGHNFDEGYPGVIRAVLDYCQAYGLKFRHVKDDWWFVKR